MTCSRQIADNLKCINVRLPSWVSSCLPFSSEPVRNLKSTAVLNIWHLEDGKTHNAYCLDSSGTLLGNAISHIVKNPTKVQSQSGNRARASCITGPEDPCWWYSMTKNAAKLNFNVEKVHIPLHFWRKINSWCSRILCGQFSVSTA